MYTLSFFLSLSLSPSLPPWLPLSATVGPNVARDNYNVVSGGFNNAAGSDDATLDNAAHATVSGGSSNTASTGSTQFPLEH